MAVSDAGGLGFLAGGYLTAERLAEQIAVTRALTQRAVGVNLFVLAETPVDEPAVAAYAASLAGDAARLGVGLGEPRFDDDELAGKLDAVVAARVPVVSLTFGPPPTDAVARLHAAGAAVWATVTDVDEAVAAAALGADALVVQGAEAGGHRGSWGEPRSVGLLPLLRLVASEVDLPFVASGGIADGASVAAVLAAGASAAQIGTALMLTPEAGTSAPHREALARGGRTVLTRAFTGRAARGIENAFVREHEAEAPAAYPHVHHLTAPLRAAARAAGDADRLHLWAGEAHALAEELPAAELVARWGEEARTALRAAGVRLGEKAAHDG